MTSSPQPEDVEALVEAFRALTLAHFPWEALLTHMEEHTRD